MPYGHIVARQTGRKVIVVVDVPEVGELSYGGRAENIVDPSSWISVEASDLRVKLVVCRPLRRRR